MTGRPTSAQRHALSTEERIRYSRHLALPEVGVTGQHKLKQAKVLVIGAGGLGSPVATYLAAGGVGRIGIADFDTVELSNLQRQPLHDTRDVGRAKTESARDRLREINPHVDVQLHTDRLTTGNALDWLSPYDVIVDGTDNLPTRYLINDACVMLGKPMVYGAIYRFEGQVGVFDATRGACYRCLHPTPPMGAAPSCAEAGVLGVLPGLIGCLQANETIKLLLGLGNVLINRLLVFDALDPTFREFGLHKDPACPLCSAQAPITELVQMEPPPSCVAGVAEWTVEELKQQMALDRPITLLDVREAYEYETAHLPASLWIPLKQVIERRYELDETQDTVVICRSGLRSANAIIDLQNSGYTGPLFNLKGGLLAWFDAHSDIQPPGL